MDAERYDAPRTKRRTMVRVALALGSLLCVSTGCAGLISHLGYWAGGSLLPAAYEDLEGRRVAVVCVSDASSYGTGSEADILSRLVSRSLGENVEGIDIVPRSEIADWDDKHDWDQLDYREVGRGVKADQVVAIDLTGFRLHEDPTLYKGRATVSVSVLDMRKRGEEVFRRSITDLTYPTHGFYHTTETTENRFRQVFLGVIAGKIATLFYEHDGLDELQPDPAGVR